VAHANRGNVLAALGRHQAAVESFDRALATNPDFAEIHLNRGNSLTRLARREEALASYDRALAIRPDMAEAHFGRAVVNRDQTRFEDEVQCLDRAIEFNRNDVVPAVYHMYRAEALNQLGRFEEAFAEVERALQVAPDDDEILFGVSLIELLHGRWLDGWRKYERRIPLKVGIPDGFSPPAWPPWRGERLQDELLVLRGEQGLGDHLMFSCFAADLAKRGYRVALWVKPGLQPLLRTVPGVERVVSDLAALEECPDIRCGSMMSVPGLLGITPDTVPRNVPFLATEPNASPPGENASAPRASKSALPGRTPAPRTSTSCGRSHWVNSPRFAISPACASSRCKKAAASRKSPRSHSASASRRWAMASTKAAVLLSTAPRS
jgi:Tfp pilus assembly protein PilF